MSSLALVMTALTDRHAADRMRDLSFPPGLINPVALSGFFGKPVKRLQSVEAAWLCARGREQKALPKRLARLDPARRANTMLAAAIRPALIPVIIDMARSEVSTAHANRTLAEYRHRLEGSQPRPVGTAATDKPKRRRK